MPKLFQLTPAGMIAEWKANAIGKGSETVNETLKKNYEDLMTREAGLKLMMRCLFDAVDNPKMNSDIATIDGKGCVYITEEQKATLAAEVEEDIKK